MIGSMTHITNMYELKQSLRVRFNRFRMTICGIRYKRCNEDHTLFYKHFRHHIIIITVYINDIVNIEDDEKEIQQLKRRLGEEFEVNDLG
jgi:Reverse transcriptase (RNA-dependent DNA polymerase)